MVVIFFHLSRGDALKTKRCSKEKSESAKGGVEECSRRDLGRARLCVLSWRLLAHLPLPGEDTGASDLARS